MADSLFDTNEDHFDEDKDYLADLTRPGGKFDRTKYTSEADMYKAIAKGKAHADRLLEHKLRETDELREEFLKVRAENVAKAKWEEFMTNRNPADDTTNTQAGNVEKPVIDDKKIEDLVAQKLNEIERKRSEQTNLDKVESRLRERFGSNAKSILRDKMNALNISEEDLKFLASKSPEAVFNTLGLNTTQETSNQIPPRSSLRSDNFTSEADIRDAVYYEKLRQTDSKKYFDPKISLQRLQDMESPEFFKRYNERRN